VIRRFDVVAVQEVRRTVTALMRTLDMLSPDWRVIVSDVTEGDDGNDERLAFVYNTKRVQPSGLVGEIVLPVKPQVVVKQFARTPYVASFKVGSTEFILVSLHVLWGTKPGDRLPEIIAIAEWMRDWAERPGDWNRNLLVLGDFNLDRLDNPLYQAFTSTGLWPPAELNDVRRTIFGDSAADHFYDQIAWFGDADDHALLESLTYNHVAGSVDFVGQVMTHLTNQSLSWKISDHLPLWVEFRRP
jgi:endonuclease/exonuclease/phosphatase family metal-dependent hydrolase